MKLLKFRVQNFRSVEDSDWITTDDVTALIGTNESGKTNLLVPLWKLNPAKDGEINAIADYPRKRYNEIRAMKQKPIFIDAYFALSEELITQLVELTGAEREEVSVAWVQRDLGGAYRFGFPDAKRERLASKAKIAEILTTAQNEITAISVTRTEEPAKAAMLSTLASALTSLVQLPDALTKNALQSLKDQLTEPDTKTTTKRSLIAPRFGQVVDGVGEILQGISTPSPQENVEARKLIKENLPFFVYYSNYGNLDSEIYLPHVIENLKRSSLGSKEEAKARTLKVLFEFVRLSPQEILELGQDLPSSPSYSAPTDAQIKATAEKKKEREILLQSASTELTEKFRNWWKQGLYRLRFQADGNHFRIWVSDERRPEEIELEGRSTGLQWFLSFYLVFLVESQEAHKGAILLLDEPGLSLHPLAQRDLSAFFENLTKTNQIAYTTHSPFLVDPDHLDRVKAVYVDDKGATAVSANLRAAESNSARSNSIYPVYAALGLSVSSTLLQGCRAVIVEGPSDQYYLSAIKNYLISKGMITPSRELIFVPSGGTRGMTAVASILMAKDDELPVAVLDSDSAGLGLQKSLLSNLYQGRGQHIIMMGELLDMPNAEIEDLLPAPFLAGIIAKHLRGPDEDFDEVFKSGAPIVPQVEQYAKQHGVTLKTPGWKVDIATLAKARLLRGTDPVAEHTSVVSKWKSLFDSFEA